MEPFSRKLFFSRAEGFEKFCRHCKYMKATPVMTDYKPVIYDAAYSCSCTVRKPNISIGFLMDDGTFQWESYKRASLPDFLIASECPYYLEMLMKRDQ